MIDERSVLLELKSNSLALLVKAESAEFEGYKYVADKFNAERKGLDFAIGLIESGKYDIKESTK